MMIFQLKLVPSEEPVYKSLNLETLFCDAFFLKTVTNTNKTENCTQKDKREIDIHLKFLGVTDIFSFRGAFKNVTKRKKIQGREEGGRRGSALKIKMSKIPKFRNESKKIQQS